MLSVAERARELEEERDAHAALSVCYERARIASELHDIVAHAISVMVVQASAGQRLADDPEATAETFEAIAAAARQAEQDMGRLVALLGDDKAATTAVSGAAGVPYDGGPNEGTAALTQRSAPATFDPNSINEAPGVRYDGGPEEGSSGVGR